MSETDFASNPSETPESSGDAALMKIWDKHNSPEAEMKNPSMPETFAAAEGDHVKAAYHWNQLPLKERQMEAAVNREFADLKKQGEALGMKTETAADMKAIQDMIAGKDKPQTAQIDRDTQASLDTFRTVVPFAKDHKEAAQHLKGWAEHIGRDPVNGWAQLAKSQMTTEQWLQFVTRLSGQPAPEPARGAGDGLRAVVDDYLHTHGLTEQDRSAIGDVIASPAWRQIKGESNTAALDRAMRTVRRNRSSDSYRQKSLNDSLAADLRATATDIYRE